MLPLLFSLLPSVIKLFTEDDKKEGVKGLVGTVLNQASTLLGVPINSKDELITHLNNNPDEVIKLKQLEADTSIKLAELEAAIIKSVNETMQVESKSDHWAQYSWRPFIGANFGLYIGSLWLLPLFDKTPATLDQNIILAITAILGVASYFRGQEKVKKAK